MREQEDEDIERLTQSTRRTTRSQGPTGNTSDNRKRKVVPSSSGRTLTERALFHLSKRLPTCDLQQSSAGPSPSTVNFSIHAIIVIICLFYSYRLVNSTIKKSLT